MLGAAAASLVALYNAVALRRPKPALFALLVGAIGWTCFGAIAGLVLSGGLHSLALALLPGRLFSVGLGVLLAWSQWSYVRGHEFLGGRVVPLLHGVITAFAVFMILPVRLLLIFQGLWMLLQR